MAYPEEAWSEQTPHRRGERNGHYTRSLITEVGRIEQRKRTASACRCDDRAGAHAGAARQRASVNRNRECKVNNDRCVCLSLSKLIDRFAVFHVFCALVLAALLVWVGCDSNGSAVEEEPEIVDIAFTTDSVALGVGEQMDFSDLLVGLTASGDSIQDADLDLDWWSTDSDVFTVENTGRATGQNSGTAFCMAEMSDGTANKLVGPKATTIRGRDSFLVMVF